MDEMEIDGIDGIEQNGQQNTPTFSATRVALTFSSHGGSSFVAFHFTHPVFAFLVVLVVVRNMKSKVSPRVRRKRERESSDSNTSNSSSSNNGTSSLSLPSLGVIFPKSNASAAALTSFLYLASGAW